MIEEVWKTIPRHKNCEASNLGNIRYKNSISPCRTTGNCNFRITPAGYYLVSINNSSESVACLVAEAFISQRPYKHECDHIDGDRSNNKLDNLQWLTKGDNLIKRDMSNNGRFPIFNSKQIKDIKQYYNDGYSFRKIGVIFNTNHTTISRVINNKGAYNAK